MFVESDSCNLHYIKHIEELEFKDELKKSPKTLSIENAQPYFKIVLSHFRHQIKTETKHLILETLYKVLTKPEFLDVFVTKGFAPALPFSHKDVIDDIFKILYLLVKNMPNSFDGFVSNSFSKLVCNRGLKALTILSIYCDNDLYRIGDISEDYKNTYNHKIDLNFRNTKTQKYNNFWPMIQILLDQKERFTKPDICVQYAALLSHIVVMYPCLCETDPNQKSDDVFGLEAFNILAQLLQPSEEESENPDLERKRIVSIYSHLCKISSKIENCLLPCQLIQTHLKDQYLCTPALELLLVSKFALDNQEEMADETFLMSLLRIAGSGNKLALLVLMRLAQRNDVSQKLIEKPAWMEKCKKAHPNEPADKVRSYIVDTLRLFLVVFNHKNLREQIVADSEFLIFLNILVETEEPDILSLCLTILRRVDNLTKEFIEDIDECEFVTRFVDASTTYDAILLLDTIGKNIYSKDVLENCAYIKRCLEKDEQFDAAATAAIDLCKFKKYKNRLISLGVDDIFKKKKKDQKKKMKAEMFLRQLDS